MKTPTKRLLFLFVILLGFTIGCSYVRQTILLDSGQVSAVPDTVTAELDHFWEVYNLIHRDYFDQPVDDVTLANGAILGMVDSLDLTDTELANKVINNTVGTEPFEPLWAAWETLHAEYDGEIDDELLVDGAIRGMIDALSDDHSAYLTPRSQESTQEVFEGEIQGIGAEVEEIDGDIFVVSPFEGSPAAGAGLRPGDILREANGEVLTGLDVYSAAQIVRGPKGTTVTLLVERDGETFTVDIVRDTIKIPSVRGEILEDNIAYARLSRFGERSTEELTDLVTEQLAQNPDGMVLDLRGNPGGLLTAAVDIGELFLGEGIVLIERFGDGEEDIYRADGKGIATDIPLVVLIDEGSASASEVIAGAIQDADRGKLMGQPSFGKGTVQTWRTLSNGGGVRLTIARWLTPDGRWIHGDGLSPDIAVELPEFDIATMDEDDFVDTQLNAAVEYLLENK